MTPPSQQTDQSSSSGSDLTWLWVLIALCLILVLCGAIVVVAWLYRKRQRRAEPLSMAGVYDGGLSFITGNNNNNNNDESDHANHPPVLDVSQELAGAPRNENYSNVGDVTQPSQYIRLPKSPPPNDNQYDAVQLPWKDKQVFVCKLEKFFN